MTTRLPVSVFFALFTISGFAGLIYESIWSHYLKLFLGHAAYAQTLVLAIFMGGMAIGSWLVSRFTRRIGNLLLGYAFAELGIGLLAIAFHRVFGMVTGWAFDTAMPALGGTGVDLFKWGLASLLILPASILLGTTFPLMSAGILRVYPETGGRSLSMLYFTNSFGAAIGVLASGFYLIDHLGLPGTILTAGLLNVTLALIVWLLTKRLPQVAAAPVETLAAPTTASRRIVRAVLILAFATGAASFIYEITWIRMLTLGLGASTHSFEVMLAAFILAMSLGAFWFRNRIANLKNDLGWLAGLLVAKAFFAVYAVWIYSDVLDFIHWMLTAVTRTGQGYTLSTLSGMLASMIVMFPTAFCAGMTLPLATHALTSRGIGESAIGKVYGANTAGCIVGAAFATHIGMELAGVKGLTGLGALLDVLVAIFVIVVTAEGARRTRSFAVIGVFLAIGVVAFMSAQLDLLRMSSGVYRQGMFMDPKVQKVAFYRDGKTATIAVTDDGTMRMIRTNGKVDASIERNPERKAAVDEATMILAAALPIAIKPNAELVANIGFGSGLTTHTLLASPKIKDLDSIEIERAMIEGAKLFEPRNSRAYADPRSHIHIEDAKTFFASAGKRYDIIVSEPSNPWVSGVSTLFSEEFYGHVKRYLKDDGLLVQWVQAYEINPGLLSTIFQALGKHFADYTVYRTGADLLVVATVKGPLPPLSAQVFSYPAFAADLRYLGYESLADLQALRMGGRAALHPLFTSTGFPANSDFFPILDQRAPRSRFRAETAEELPLIREGLVPVLALLDGDWPTPLSRVQAGGRNRPQRVDRTLVGAEAIGVMMSGSADSSRVLSAVQMNAALLAHALMDNCAGATAQWVDALTEVALAAMPYLNTAEAAVMFDRARASKCYQSLTEPQRRHIAWLQAINDLDAGAIYTQAEFLLRNTPAREPEHGLYVLSALTGAVASGRIAEARALRDLYVPKLSKRSRDMLAMNLVLAHLAQAPQAR
jgi:predicted membrane-bound spermidine synthase